MDVWKLLVLATTVWGTAATVSPCIAQQIEDKAIFLRQAQKKAVIMPRPDTVSLVFLGDIMMHTDQITNAARLSGTTTENRTGLQSKSFDFSHYFSDIENDIKNADLAVANMEFTLAGEPYSGYPSFSAPDSFAEYLAKCGIDVLLTANNHILDKGGKGYSRTMSICDSLMLQHGTMTTGSSATREGFVRNNPLLTIVNGIKIALVNFTYGTNSSVSSEYPKINREGSSDLKESMMRAKEYGADIIIALPHWGEEYNLKHSSSQEETANWLADNGADIIIGSHPHVIQDSLTINSGNGRKIPVIFSLGNAISNMSAPNTQAGLLLTVNLLRRSNGKTCITGIDYQYTWCSLPGRLSDSHTVIKIKEYLSRKELWKAPYEWHKMTDTYYRIQEKTGITDKK